MFFPLVISPTLVWLVIDGSFPFASPLSWWSFLIYFPFLLFFFLWIRWRLRVSIRPAKRKKKLKEKVRFSTIKHGNKLHPTKPPSEILQTPKKVLQDHHVMYSECYRINTLCHGVLHSQRSYSKPFLLKWEVVSCFSLAFSNELMVTSVIFSFCYKGFSVL